MWLFADIKSVPDVIRHYGRQSPDKQALTEGKHAVSFAELDQFTSRLANALALRGGVEHAVVAFIGKNSIPFFDLMFGATKAGCAILPLNWRLTVTELVPIVRDGQPVIVFADRDFVATMETVKAQCGAVFEILALDAQASVHGGLEALAANASAVDP
ncbi:MAG: 4-isopropylbenzoate-CoA ligase, partial [Pseudomonadota bacterium]